MADTCEDCGRPLVKPDDEDATVDEYASRCWRLRDDHYQSGLNACRELTVTRLRAELAAAKEENEAFKQLTGWVAWGDGARRVYPDGPFLVAYQRDAQVGFVTIELGDGYGKAAVSLARKLGLLKGGEGRGS